MTEVKKKKKKVNSWAIFGTQVFCVVFSKSLSKDLHMENVHI